MKEFPQFVKLNTIVLRLDGTKYRSDNGAWSVDYKFKGGNLYSDHEYNLLNDKIMTPCSLEDYREEVGRYAVK